MPIISVYVPDKMLKMLFDSKHFDDKHSVSVFLRNMMILGTVKYLDAKRAGKPIDEELEKLFETLVPSED